VEKQFINEKEILYAALASYIIHVLSPFMLSEELALQAFVLASVSQTTPHNGLHVCMEISHKPIPPAAALCISMRREKKVADASVVE
jgi:hypothetical protein